MSLGLFLLSLPLLIDLLTALLAATPLALTAMLTGLVLSTMLPEFFWTARLLTALLAVLLALPSSLPLALMMLPLPSVVVVLEHSDFTVVTPRMVLYHSTLSIRVLGLFHLSMDLRQEKLGHAFARDIQQRYDCCSGIGSPTENCESFHGSVFGFEPDAGTPSIESRVVILGFDSELASFSQPFDLGSTGLNQDQLRAVKHPAPWM